MGSVNAPAGLGEERRFGLALGTALTAAGTWWVYRGKASPFGAPASILGLALFFCGIFAPGTLVSLLRAWTAVAHAISWVLTRAVVFLVFFLIVTPIGIGRRLSCADPFRRRPAGGRSSWQPVRPLDRHHFLKSY